MGSLMIKIYKCNAPASNPRCRSSCRLSVSSSVSCHSVCNQITDKSSNMTKHYHANNKQIHVSQSVLGVYVETKKQRLCQQTWYEIEIAPELRHQYSKDKLLISTWPLKAWTSWLKHPEDLKVCFTHQSQFSLVRSFVLSCSLFSAKSSLGRLQSWRHESRVLYI